MDPITIATAVITIVGASFNIATFLYNSHERYRRADQQVTHFNEQIERFRNTWELVNRRAERWRPNLTADLRDELATLSAGSAELLEEMRVTLERFIVNDKRRLNRDLSIISLLPFFRNDHRGFKNQVRRWRVFFDRDDMKDSLERMRDYGLTLSLILNMIK